MKARGSWAADPRRQRFRSGDLEEYRRRLQAFQQRFAESFGYEIRDPFEDVCTMLGDRKAFAYSRFGDGEFKAVFGVEGMNCDGHQFFPEMGGRLTEILVSKPDYTLGLLPLAVRVHGMERILALSEGIHWVLANSFPLALLDGRLGAFFDALAGREVLLVGPSHLQELSSSREWAHLPIPSRDCWTEYDEIHRRLRESIAAADSVVLFCASMMSNVLIDDLHKSNPTNTYVDVGSAFDPLCGVNSRLYHDALNPAVLKGIGNQT